jgi:hypothetical protein
MAQPLTHMHSETWISIGELEWMAECRAVRYSSNRIIDWWLLLTVAAVPRVRVLWLLWGGGAVRPNI